MTPPSPPDANAPGALKLAQSPRPFTCVNGASKSPAAGTDAIAPPTRRDPGLPPEPHAPSVTAILRDQRTREAALGLDELAPAPRRSNRRTQDFWVMLAGGNALIVGAMALTQFSPVSLVYGGSGAVLYSLGLAWIVWVVMDRY
jgi:hypothetical protein